MAKRSWLRTLATIAAAITITVTGAARSVSAAPPPPVSTPAATPTPAGEVKSWNFDHDEAGKMASGWKAIVGDWQVLADSTAPSQPNAFGLPPGRVLTTLAHLLEYYPHAILDDPAEYSDFTYEAQFKAPVNFHFDCSGGIIFRYVDDNNYYLLSAGCPSDYFALSRVTAGKLAVLKQQVLRTDPGTWYNLKVVAQGSHFSCFENDKLVFDVDDGKFAAGRIGLWARDDSQ
ncbi:MAG TPA: family 16 glycoside hydrolase, partial [Candidatus Binataceae bacterium]|nr:family 16 glycoside hydrolase [Candidatus Binataceae bacterium]